MIDEAAFAELYDRHAPALAAWLRRRSDPDTAQELLAETFAEAAPALDAPLTARWLLASLGPGHYVHARRALGWEVERLKAGWAAMTAALCATRS